MDAGLFPHFKLIKRLQSLDSMPLILRKKIKVELIHIQTDTFLPTLWWWGKDQLLILLLSYISGVKATQIFDVWHP